MNLITTRIIITFSVILLQAYFPQITILGISFSPDILLVFLTVIAFLWGSVQTIVIGFIIGLCQDFTTQVELLGMFAFAKSISGYGLTALCGYAQIWSRFVKYLVLFGIYTLHFMVYFYVSLNNLESSFILGLSLVLIQSISTLVVFRIINKFIFNSKLL